MDKKKYIVGLSLSSSCEDWKTFLTENLDYIECVYFSLPLGNRFHSRQYIARQFGKQGMEEHFWKLISITQDINVPLELVLNTPHLSKDDIENSSEVLKAHNADISYITILDAYYDIVKKNFKESTKINYSYNNFFNGIEDLNDHIYDRIIIGRHHIRNINLFKRLNEKGLKVVLLLNNGCSHRCGWCHKIDHCNKAFIATNGDDSIDYLYAEQSIMPFELHEGLLDFSSIYCFKINNRNSDIDYLRKCLDSYRKNDNNLHDDTSNWSLWARLAWFSPHYNELNLNKIISIKRKIYAENPIIHKQYVDDKMSIYSIILNLCDEYSVKKYDQKYIFETLKDSIIEQLKDYKFKII